MSVFQKSLVRSECWLSVRKKIKERSLNSLFVFFQLKEGIEPSTQRWFFGGKLLGDRVRIDEIKVLPGYVIQVVVNSGQDK